MMNETWVKQYAISALKYNWPIIQLYAVQQKTFNQAHSIELEDTSDAYVLRILDGIILDSTIDSTCYSYSTYCKDVLKINSSELQWHYFYCTQQTYDKLLNHVNDMLDIDLLNPPPVYDLYTSEPVEIDSTMLLGHQFLINDELFVENELLSVYEKFYIIRYKLEGNVLHYSQPMVNYEDSYDLYINHGKLYKITLSEEHV